MKSLIYWVLVATTAIPMQDVMGTQKIRPRLESTITVSGSGQSAFQAIVATAVANRIPFGIVIDDKHEICAEYLEATNRTESMAQFVNDLNASLPGYTAVFTGEVLNVFPRRLTTKAQEFLNINIPQFHSDSDSHQGLGVNLWMYIRAVIAPNEATAYAGASSTNRETVSGMEVKNQNVKSILNEIVNKGEGGIWILKSDLIKDLSPSTPRPYEVKGYVGEEQTIRGFSCR